MKIRSLLFTAVLVTAVLCLPFVVSAASLTSAQISAIMSLLQAFGADSATVANVQTSLNGGTPSINASPVAWCHTFNTNIKFRDNNDEVSELENALEKDGINVPFFPNAEAKKYFNAATSMNVIEFQKKYGIPQTGYVGPLTRAKLNALYKCATTPNSTQQSINVQVPRAGDVLTVGQRTEISWGNYTRQNGDNAIFDITEFSSSGRGPSMIASITPSQAGCNGHQAAVCSYFWTPDSASPEDQINISERGTNNNGRSGTFSVVSSTQPSITVTSPNGGQAFNAGQNIIVSWNATGLNPNRQYRAEITIGNIHSSQGVGYYLTKPCYTPYTSINQCNDITVSNGNNNATLTLPSNYISPGNYPVRVDIVDWTSFTSGVGETIPIVAGDTSDGSISILLP